MGKSYPIPEDTKNPTVNIDSLKSLIKKQSRDHIIRDRHTSQSIE